jgi:Immunoglobulin I-set domain
MDCVVRNETDPQANEGMSIELMQEKLVDTGSARLRCKTQKFLYSSHRWFLKVGEKKVLIGNSTWSSDSRITTAWDSDGLYSSQLDLVIVNLGLNDTNAVFICRAALNQTGLVREQQYRLVVHPATLPAIEEGKASPLNLSVIISQDVTISCPVRGDPKPSVKWFKDGIELESGKKVWISSDGQMLIIGNVTRNDEGEYFCVVSNVKGSLSKSFRLNVMIIVHPTSPPPPGSGMQPSLIATITVGVLFFFLSPIIAFCIVRKYSHKINYYPMVLEMAEKSAHSEASPLTTISTLGSKQSNPGTGLKR